MASVGRDLSNSINPDKVFKGFRYVDDFLVLLKKRDDASYPNTVTEILGIFNRDGKGLTFTHELPLYSSLQFLDINLNFLDDHVCWEYSPRTAKALLPYDSSHSKTVKRAIASSCLHSALYKSCEHAVDKSFGHQMTRLEAAGFPRSMLTAVAEDLLRKTKTVSQRVTPEPLHKKVRPEIIPYAHRVAHNLKKVAARYKVPIVFSAPFKLGTLCARTDPKKKRIKTCDKKHAKPFVNCIEGVVYQIPLNCGKVYIGQTGRCVNDRLREHALSIKNGTGSHLPFHCKECQCVPEFEKNKYPEKKSGHHGT